MSVESNVDDKPVNHEHHRARHLVDMMNAELVDATPHEVIEWAYKEFGSALAMTSSFGAQSAAMLHLCTEVVPHIPVILIDTGYLFPETYRFVEELKERLKLNLIVVMPELTAARQEALYGKLWEQGEAGMDQYLDMNKVKPLRKAIESHNIKAWCSGVRAQQTKHRAQLRMVEFENNAYNIHPILGWTKKQVHEYLKKNNLPHHPLWAQGYESIGDTHSTDPVAPGEDERSGRFKGLKEECGIHLPATPEEDKSRASSDL